MPKKSIAKKDDDKKLFAFLAVFLSIVGFVIALLAKKEDRYVMFYAKQSLVLFILAIIINVASFVLTLITFGLFSIIAIVLWVGVLILWVIQIVNSLSGDEKETPLIGSYASRINL